MIKTEFYDAFFDYYDKAATLQYRNCGNADSSTKCNDPIMDNVTIYDTVNRKYAGFSKALEDIHGVRCENHLKRYPDYSDKLDIVSFHFIHLFHRFTGSGASFRPTFNENGERREDEHGYYNNHVNALCSVANNQRLIENRISAIRKYIVECKVPMVTSIGNQPPSLKNGDPSKYRLAQQYYFDNFAEHFIKDYITYIRLNSIDGPVGIKDTVDFCCKWHKDRGFKQWHFVLTAFVMDTAEYYPELVNQDSHCYYGANCIRSFKLMFEKEKTDKVKNDIFYEQCMTDLVKKRPQSKPYDMEDVCCDFIRYIVEYVPKGYDHLSEEQTKNNSILKLAGEYTLAQKERIKKILG